MSVIGDTGTRYVIDKVIDDGTTTTVHLDNPQSGGAEAFAASAVFSGFTYLDANNDSTNNETVYRVNTSIDTAVSANATSGDLFIDIAQDGVSSSGGQLTITSATTIQDLSSYDDNAIVYTDTSTGNVYRKVPVAYNSDHSLVYLDAMNRGTYDEVRYHIVAADPNGDGLSIADLTTTDGNVNWVLDENFDELQVNEEAVLLIMIIGYCALGTTTSILWQTSSKTMVQVPKSSSKCLQQSESET